MNRLTMIVISAPLLLIGATDPNLALKKRADDGAAGPSASYRPCRPGPGDDRCIQLYERGVRSAYARWQRDQGDGSEGLAMGGPEEPAARAPRQRHQRPMHERMAMNDQGRMGGRHAHRRHHGGEGHGRRHAVRCVDETLPAGERG